MTTHQCACNCQDNKIETEETSVSRRAMIAGVGAVGAAAVLAGCGAAEEAKEAAGEKVSEAASAVASAAGSAIGKTADIPVGGAKLYKAGTGVIVTHPAEGNFVAFDAKCPHKGCLVADGLTDGKIVCACHNSIFDASTGERLEGPAMTGLTKLNVSVEGDSLKLA